MYAAIQGAARLVVAPGAMAPAGFCILSAFRRGSARRGLPLGSSARFLFFHLCDGFGDPRRRSRSVGASASAPGSVARSSADVLTAPDTRSGCPSVVDMVRGLFCLVFGWRLAPCVSNCDGVKRNRNNCFEAFRLTDFLKQAIRTRPDRFLKEKNALVFWEIDRFLGLSKCSQQFHVRAYTKSHWQKWEWKNLTIRTD